jgi:hypothetical protein
MRGKIPFEPHIIKKLQIAAWLYKISRDGD